MPRPAFVAVAVVLFGLCACRPKLPPPAPVALPRPDARPALLAGAPAPLSPRIASYRIHARLDTAAHLIVADETLRWRHDGNAPVASVPLHLYLNAFKNESTVFMRESHGHHRAVEKKTDSWGYIDVPSIAWNGVELRAGARYGEDETTLELPLPRPLQPGEELVLEIRFTAQLPEVFARTGYRGEFYMVGQWFPKIGVLTVEDGAQRWHCDTFHLNSEFFADFGVYDVELDVPDSEVIAATGVLTEARELGGGRRLLVYRAEDVHDFAFMADPYMKVLVGRARSSYGDVEVRIYHRPGYEAYAPGHLEAARRTIETFGARFVPYPWAVMSVVDPPWAAATGAGGMEYPTIVTTVGDLAIPGSHLGEGTTVHEVGHNWFQGMLASNEVDEAYLDEGVNEYADGLVLDEMFGPGGSLSDAPWLRLGYYDGEGLRTDARSLIAPIATKSYAFPPNEYGEATYIKTAQVLKTLETLAGRERFLAALGLYARRTAFKHPTGKDLLAALHDGLGGELDGFVRAAFLEPGGVDFRLARIRNDRRHEPRGVFGDGEARRTVGGPDDATPAAWRSEVTVENLGRLEVGGDVVVRFEDGSEARERWDGRGRWKTFVYERAAPVVAAEVDPEWKVRVEHERLRNGSTPAEPAPLVRAAARAGFWTQTLLQLAGGL